MPTATLDITATSRTEGENTVLTVTLRNPTKAIALMTHLQLHRKTVAGNQQDTRVLPVFYSDNYISLVPGETREITIEAATKDLAPNGAPDPSILIDGYNIAVNPV